jgi:CheY-like chemotaxis protein
MSKKILVVDDEPAIVKVLSTRLESNGYQVITAVDGKEGIKEAKLQKPDLIVMDIMMPNLTGGDAVRILKLDNITKDIPIIFLTAVTANMPQGAENTGVNVDGKFFTAIAKPFESKILLLEIKKLLPDLN